MAFFKRVKPAMTATPKIGTAVAATVLSPSVGTVYGVRA
jgi:hypothetical protein